MTFHKSLTYKALADKTEAGSLRERGTITENRKNRKDTDPNRQILLMRNIYTSVARTGCCHILLKENGEKKAGEH